MQRWRWRTGWGLVALGAAGCGGAATEPDTLTRSGALAAASAADAGSPEGVLQPDAVAPLASGSCADVLAALHADLFERTRRRADQARESPYAFTPDANPGGPFEDPVPNGVSSDMATPAPAGVAGSESPSGEVAGSALGLVAGDFIASDGDRLLVLDFFGEAQRLIVVQSAPADDLRVLSTVPIEGNALELVSRGGRVLVFSRIVGALPGVDESFPDYEPVFTKLTVLDVSVDPPDVRRELYVEGDYVFARRHGGLVRAVIQHLPKLRLDAPVLSDTDILGRARPREQIDAQVDAWVQITDDSVRSSSLDAYLPGVYERQGGALVARAPSCDDVFVPRPGRAAPGATSIVSFDLDALDAVDDAAGVAAPLGVDPLQSLTVFGYAQGVALDRDAAVFRQTQTIQDLSSGTRSESHLHLFELDGTEERHAASGDVPGFMHGIDLRAGMLRAASTEEVYSDLPGIGRRYQGNESRVRVLRIQGGRLTELGNTVIAAANESIGSARFIEDRAFLLTTNVASSPAFGEATTDLVAFDLLDPRAPRETGRLPVAGHSNVLLPVPGDRLLSSTSAPDPDMIYSHAELLLFDVADPAAPGLAVQHTYGPRSSADSDPRAVAFSPDLARFGLPVSDGTIGSGFDVFELGSFTRLGSIRPESPELTLIQCRAMHGEPTDPETIAAIEANPTELAATLEQCNATRPRPFVLRAVLREQDVLVLSRSSYPVARLTVAAYGLDGLGSAPLSQVEP